MKPILVLKSWLASRARKVPPSTIVLHATAGSSLGGAVSTLKIKGLSYHYLIEKNGQITKCVPTGRVAFHAGKSVGPQGENCNSYSIGVSLVNLNNGKDPYPQAQVAACADLCKELADAIPSLRWLTCHYSVSPGRKTDPRGFPAAMIASEAGLTPWQVAI